MLYRHARLGLPPVSRRKKQSIWDKAKTGRTDTVYALGLGASLLRGVEDEPIDIVSEDEETDKGPGTSADEETCNAIIGAARNRLTLLKLKGGDNDYQGTARFADLGDFSDAVCTVKATRSGESWRVEAQGSVVPGRPTFQTGQVKLTADNGKIGLKGRARLRPVGLFDGGEVDLDAVLGDDGVATAELGSVHGTMRLPLGFEGGVSSFHGMRVDIISGRVDATTGELGGHHPLLGDIAGKDLGIANSKLFGRVELSSPTLDIPKGDPIFSGEVKGSVDILDGDWSVGRLGGDGRVLAPGFKDGIEVTFDLDLGPNGPSAFRSKLKKETALNEHVDLTEVDVKVDLERAEVELVGRARVHDVPGFETTSAKFEADSRAGFMRVTVDRIALKATQVGDASVKGEARQMTLENAGLGFSASEVSLEVTLPYLGAVQGKTSVFKNKLQQTALKLTRKVTLPASNPLLEGQLDATLAFDGTSFSHAESRLPLTLNLGAEKRPDIFDLLLTVSKEGEVAMSAAMKSAIRLSKFLSVEGGRLGYDKKDGVTGNLDFTFHDIAGASVAVPMPVQSKEAERSVLNPKPGQDAFAFSLEAGFTTGRGPFVEGHVHLGKNDRSDARAGRFFVPASALLGGGGAGFEVNVAGFKLMDGLTRSTKLVDMPKQRFKIAAFPLGGLFAEAGATLGLDVEVDPVLADLTGRASNVDLSTLNPGDVVLKGHLQGGLTGRLTGRPVLGLGAYLGAESIARLSGGLALDVPAVVHGTFPGEVGLGFVDGKLQAMGKVNPRLYFGMSATPVPYYDLSLLGDAIQRQGNMKALPTVTLFEQQQVAELELAFGHLDTPKVAEEGLDFTMSKVDASVPVPPPEMQKLPPVEVAPEKTEVGGDPSAAFGGGAWDLVKQSYGKEPWFQVTEKVLDFIAWVADALKITESELQAALDFLKEYVDLAALDERFFSNFKRPGGAAGKMGLIQALTRVLFGRGDGNMHAESGTVEGETTERTLDAQRVHELRFGLATVRVKQGSEPGRVLLTHSPFHGRFTIDQDESRLEMNERNEVQKGVLAAKLDLGAWGKMEALRFGIGADLLVKPEFHETDFVAGEKLAEASVVFPGAVSGAVVGTATDLSRVTLKQKAKAGLPDAVGGVKLESPPTEVGFVQRDGTWNLSSANGVTIPFAGGNFTAKLSSYEVSEIGISAKGMLFMDAGHLGRAGGNVEIEKNTVKSAELGFERPRVDFPEGNPVVSGQLQGGLKIADGSLTEARVGMAVGVRTSLEGLEEVGVFEVRFQKVGEAWRPAFVAKVDEKVVGRMKLGDYGQMRSFESSLTPEGKFGAIGTFDVDLPGLGKLQNAALGYHEGQGIYAKAVVPVDNSLLKGDLQFTYHRGQVTIGGRGHFSPPGLEPFDGEIEVGTQRLRVVTDPKQDVLKLSFGDYAISGSIEELMMDRKSGAFAGRMSLKGTLPAVGEVAGEAVLGDPNDPNAPFLKQASLRFMQKELAIPEKDPFVKGGFAGELNYGPKGLSGRVHGTSLKLDAQGLGEGATATFEAQFKEKQVTGGISIEPGEHKPGSVVRLKAFGADLDDKGIFRGAGAVTLVFGANETDIAARIDENGYIFGVQGLSLGDPMRDKIWGTNIGVAYSSKTGLALTGEGGLRAGGIDANLSLDYRPGGSGQKLLNARATVAKTLYEGSGRKERELAGMNLSFLILPILPGLLDLFGEVGLQAKLAYQFTPVVLSGQAEVQGLDLGSGAFSALALRPELTGGVVVDLVGGPSFGLMAGVGGGLVAYAKGSVGFDIGGRGRMHPQISGLIEYRNGELAGGASLEMPLWISAIGTPKVSAEVGILNGFFKKKVEGRLDDIVLMEPRQVMNLKLGMGALKTPDAPTDLATMIPDDPMSGPRAAAGTTPSGALIDTSVRKSVAPKEAETERSRPGGADDVDLRAQRGLFSLQDAKKAVTNKVTELKDLIAGAYNTLCAIGDRLSSLARSGFAKASVHLESTARWVLECFGSDPEAAKKAVFNFDSLEDIPKIDEYDGLKSSLELIRKHQAEMHDENVKTMKSGTYSTTALLALGAATGPLGLMLVSSNLHRKESSLASERLESEEHSLSLATSLEHDVDLASKNEDRKRRLAFINFIEYMMGHNVPGVLEVFKPTGKSPSAWDDFKDDKGRHNRLIEAFVTTTGNMGEFYKNASPGQLIVWRDFLVNCMAYSGSQVSELAERITRTYFTGWVYGNGDVVREQFKKAGILK